ncbi:MAG: hypothetical protein MRZ29_04345 [Oscillospiraceae bacterium]|nr:hypothetical protein [Oscillospiraceae bacterium]
MLKTAVCYRYKQSGGGDIAILWSAKEDGEDVSVSLGCSKITVYDEYGNASEMASENGIYSFRLNQSTIYLTGDFNVCAKN